MRLPRMTTRRWMVAVAVVGLSLGTYRMLRSIEDFRMHCALQMLIHDLGPDVKNPRRGAYHAAMFRKWERASDYAWLPVEPDPPEP
jgi:hypothetical protein